LAARVGFGEVVLAGVFAAFLFVSVALAVLLALAFPERALSVFFPA
jgi:hypothetical protein